MDKSDLTETEKSGFSETEKYFKYIQHNKNWNKPKLRSKENSLWNPRYARYCAKLKRSDIK